MSEKAHALGIRKRDLTKALMLARDFRATAFTDGLDPRAVRIAVIYLNLCDLHFARQRLSAKDLAALEEIAREYYDQVRRGT